MDESLNIIQKEIILLKDKLKYFYYYDDIEMCREIQNKIRQLQKLLTNDR